MRLSKRLKHSAVFYLLQALRAGFSRLPRHLALLLGGLLGLGAWRLLPRDRYRISRHLTVAYGDALTARERQNIGRAFFVNTGKNLVDVIRMRDKLESEIRPLVQVDGLDHFDRAYRRGRGVIGVTGHLGNFELLAAYVASLGYSVAVIGREMGDSRLDGLLVSNREAVGLTNLSTSESPRPILTWLKNGGAIGVLIDQDSIRIRSTFVPAFGRPALTPIGQTIIGLKTGAAFVPMALLRTEDNRYQLVIRPEVRHPDTADPDDAIREVTAACTLELEAIIDQYKDQWIWLKNRWLTAPADIS